MKRELAPLPWNAAALEPYISAHTIDVHYGRHHRGYLEKLVQAIEGTDLAEADLEEIIRTSRGPIFNSAAQVWNHDFFWRSMRPKGGGEPTGSLRDEVIAGFGSVEGFRERFVKAAEDEFGSGWVWLVLHRPSGELRIVSTTDAENPLTEGSLAPLATVDVWEHAYYLDYENERAKFVEAVLQHLFDWDFVAVNLDRASPRAVA